MRYKSLTLLPLSAPLAGPVMRYGSAPGPSILDREFARVKIRYLSGPVAWLDQTRPGMGFVFLIFAGIAAAASAIVAAVIAAIAAAIAAVLAFILVPLGVSAAMIATASAALTGLVTAKLLSAVGLPPWASTVLGVLTGSILIPDLSSLTSPKALAEGALSQVDNADLGAGLSGLADTGGSPAVHDVGDTFMNEGHAVEDSVTSSAAQAAEGVSATGVTAPSSDALPTGISTASVTDKAVINSPATKEAVAGVLAEAKKSLPGIDLSKLDPKDILAFGLSLLSPGKKPNVPPGAQIVYEYEYYYPEGGEPVRKIVPRIVYPTDWGMVAAITGSLAAVVGGAYLMNRKRL